MTYSLLSMKPPVEPCNRERNRLPEQEKNAFLKNCVLHVLVETAYNTKSVNTGAAAAAITEND